MTTPDHTWYSLGDPGAPKPGDLVVTRRERSVSTADSLALVTRLRSMTPGELAAEQARHVAGTRALRGHSDLAGKLEAMTPGEWLEYAVGVIMTVIAEHDQWDSAPDAPLVLHEVTQVDQGVYAWTAYGAEKVGVSHPQRTILETARFATPEEIASEAGQLAIQAYQQWLATQP